MLTLLISVALAATPVERVKTATQDAPGAMFALSCTPMGPLLEIARGVPDNALQKVPGVGEWLHQLPAEISDIGLDPAGDLDLMADPSTDTASIEIAFPGTRTQAEDLLSHLFPNTLVIEEAGWSGVSHKIDWDVHLADGKLLFENGTSRPASAPQPQRPPVAVLLDGLSEDHVCAFALDFPAPGKSNKKLTMVGTVADNSLRMQVANDDPTLPTLQGDGSVPMTATSTTPPTAVFTVGFPLLDRLTSPAVSAEYAKPFRELAEHVRIPGGVSVALFLSDDHKDVVAVFPVTNTHGRPVPARRMFKALQRGLPQQAVPFRKTGKTSFTTEFKGHEIFAITRKGRLVLGTQADRVLETTEGVGTPWLTADDARWSSEWALAMMVPLPLQQAGLLEDIGLRIGLSSDSEIIDAALQLTGPVPDIATLMQVVSALLQQDAAPQLKQILRNATTP